MGNWKCKVCGYTHQGDEPPDLCPQCGAAKSQFYETSENTGCASSIALVILILIPVIALFSCKSQLSVDNSVVKKLDIQQYLGTWYEIARLDHRFERDMNQCTATYTMEDNGSIKVINRGMKDGEWRTSIGKGKVTDEPGVLRVSFFGPFYSDYRIMMVASDYSYALIGGSDDDYLWILSRKPQLKKNTLDYLVREAKERGYSTDDLIWVQQSK